MLCAKTRRGSLGPRAHGSYVLKVGPLPNTWDSRGSSLKWQSGQGVNGIGPVFQLGLCVSWDLGKLFLYFFFLTSFIEV